MFVLVIVMSRDELPLFEPSMVTKSAPFRTINALALEPVMAVVTPVAGLIVIVLVELAPEIELITIGKTSPVFSGDVVLFASSSVNVTGPVTPSEFNLPTAWVSVV